MADREKASRLDRKGFDLDESGKFQEAVERYREALECADPDHHGTPDHHAGLAAALAALGRDAESHEQWERSLSEKIRHSGENTTTVMVARWFLGEHLLKMHEPAAALGTVEPSLSLGLETDWPLRMTQAEALWELRRGDEARPRLRCRLRPPRRHLRLSASGSMRFLKAEPDQVPQFRRKGPVDRLGAIGFGVRLSCFQKIWPLRGERREKYDPDNLK